MHPYITQQLIDDRRQRLRDQADTYRLVDSRPSWWRRLRRSRRLVLVPAEVEVPPVEAPEVEVASALPSVAAGPGRPAA